MLTAATAAAIVSVLAGCQRAQNAVGAGTVSGERTGATSPAAATAANADTDMAQVLNALSARGAKPVESLSVAQARSQPTPADAVRRVQRERGQSTAPRPVARVRDISVPTPAGPIPARLYDPGRGAAGRAAPMIVYWHGGGWVIADLETYDASARALAEETGAVVLSAHYRQGPEHRFPAAHDDAVAVCRWATQNARRLGADPTRTAVAGESAGGNLAINAAIAARDMGLPLPVHMALIYPVAGTDTNTPSYRENTAAVPLSRAGILWFVENYTHSQADLQDPRLDVYGRGDLRGLPPATVVNAEIDPLRSDGEILAQKLREAGVQAEQRTYQGVMARVLRHGAAGGRRHSRAGLRRAKAAERLRRRQGFDSAPLTRERGGRTRR